MIAAMVAILLLVVVREGPEPILMLTAVSKDSKPTLLVAAALATAESAHYSAVKDLDR